ncbi:pyridoxamine 5'-phosphate oxidase family protein [Alteromonas sp. ASW11-130]|uniref:pyridoxamine 5'-phosphate oxidase family protein n=1 Tax=Alteromonas sp. ASW11-130 TaxID=3015775 RepID=UPI002241A4B6|nr:pyridoxamine 5'-phosphate oxidase family protein [Alteromonas sp. ASW11-130]MCW8091400.1 pyridoxamine 5'-phosphate oxidase family protein [Alteromonas sp. ASW11-130]
MSTDIRTKMWKAMAESPNVMVSLVNAKDHAEPMHAQLDKDADHEFWFYTKKDNRIAPGGPAMVCFTGRSHEVFACIKGNLVEETRQEIIDKYWSNHVEAWYDNGKDDPALKMMRFELENAEIWNADPGIKGVFKLMTGKRMKEDDMGEHKKVNL